MAPSGNRLRAPKSRLHNQLRALWRLVFQVHLQGWDWPSRAGLGGTLTVIYTAQSEAPRSKTRGALLPLLVVLFLISYGILTLLVVEQGRTIEAQRTLLREMLKDSTQLADLKGKLAHNDAMQSNDKPAAEKSEEPEAKPPASDHAVKPQQKESKRSGKQARTLKTTPEKPAADLQDVRRSTRVI